MSKTEAVEKDLFGNAVQKEKDNVYVKKNTKQKKDLSQSIQTKYVIEITCKDEQEQELMYNELMKKGFDCQILTL